MEQISLVAKLNSLKESSMSICTIQHLVLSLVPLSNPQL